jgi:hypothetical protein
MDSDDFRVGVLHGDEVIGSAIPDGDRLRHVFLHISLTLSMMIVPSCGLVIRGHRGAREQARASPVAHDGGSCERQQSEIEIGVLGCQCLDRRIGSQQHLISEIAAWERQRNISRARIKWMFTTWKARGQMGRACPKLSAKKSKSTAGFAQIARLSGRRHGRDRDQ